jgi:signal transduction histidine kinase
VNLKAKTSLSISAFIVVILFTHAYLHVKQEEKDQKDDLLSGGMTFAKLTATQLTSDYDKYYHKAFYTFLPYVRDLYSSNEDLYKIEIADVNGNILLGTEEINTTSPINNPQRILQSEWEYKSLMSITPKYRYVLLDGRELLEISYPVLLQGGVHKHNVFYYYSFDALEKRLSEMKFSTGGLVLLFVILGFLGASIFSYGLTRNLNSLVKHAHSIAKGNLNEPVTVHSKDELGDLASSFENMRSELRKKTEEIESYNRKLEEKVRERTMELEGLTTQLKKNNVILQKANEKLMELDKLKSEFLANTSHELRTPLTSIIGYSQCVLAEIDGPLPESHKNNIKKILGSGKDLLALINRILDFSKLESGRIGLRLEEMDIRDVIEEAVTTVRPMSQEKGLSLISNIEPELPLLQGDRMRVKQAIINLLSNAIKFTEKGFVRVNASRNNGDLQVSIRDSGIGIAREDYDSIFEPFQQVDGSEQRKHGGSGLGLSISRRLIELHKGRLWVESEKDIGSTFSFTIPVIEEGNADDNQNG